MPKPKTKIEKRVFPVKEFRVKQNDDGQTILEGHSAVFDSPSEDMGWGDFEVREYIAQDAFTKALKTSDTRALFNHDPNFVLGRESANTLNLTQDKKGLFSSIIMPKTNFAKDLTISVERGDIKEQSFAFIVAKDKWEEDKEKKTATRTIIEIKELIDVSIVTYPAYPDTDIAKRSLEQFRSNSEANLSDDKKDLENKALDENIVNFLYGDKKNDT